MDNENDVLVINEGSEINIPIQSSQTRLKRRPFDLPLFILIITILCIGVIMVLSASFATQYYSGNKATDIFLRQSCYAVIGIAVMIVFSFIKPKVFKKWSGILFFLSVILLALVLFVGRTGGGSKRWIFFGPISVQPSEIVKLAEILAFARMICDYGSQNMKRFRYGVVPFAAYTAVIVLLLAAEPHYSAALIIIFIAVIMMFAGGTDLKWFILAIIGVVLVVYIAYNTMDYIKDRISAWQHPENDPLDTGFQVLQSLYAIGSGGLTGLGLGNSRQKYLYLPESHNDYIFSIVCEELGFIGAIMILILFAVLIIRCFWIAIHAKSRYDSLIVVGISGLLAIQVFLNVAVVTNLIPSTGISLPFFSYGGSALLIQMVEMGIVLSVSREITSQKDKQEELE